MTFSPKFDPKKNTIELDGAMVSLQSAPPEKIVKGSGTILLIDDQQMILEVTAEMLKKLGFTVLVARSGEEAIRIYEENRDRIDVVLLDMIMPGMDGGETYDRLKAINPGIKVLLSSGYSINSEAENILNRGCEGFMQKPFGMHELSRKLHEVMDKKP